MARDNKGKTKVTPSNDVIRGRLQGASLATHLASKRRGGSSSGDKKKGKAKVKVLYPPEGGWRG